MASEVCLLSTRNKGRNKWCIYAKSNIAFYKQKNFAGDESKRVKEQNQSGTRMTVEGTCVSWGANKRRTNSDVVGKLHFSHGSL